ncbi:GAF and ANTAR domain-containing protein [Geodermatophilus maliterrae]|uniref:GAF and ANTAR domain-containing protein n=1 Tax=Geodermatophilus maliterrae TaxID=3162531 RepID=A0ABV3XB61_9ACTN
MSPEQQPHPSTVGEVLEYLGRPSLRQQPMEGLLQRVTDLVKAVMPGRSEASVTLLVRARPSTVVATGRLAVDLDEGQYERGHGPCLHAAATRETTEIPDTRSETRWPDHARRAAEHGNLSSLSVPLVIDGPQVSGAMNIYARQPNAFDEASRSAATRIGPYAAVAAGNLHLYRCAVKRAVDLEAALASRAVIEQAKGILIERHDVDAYGAFRILARASVHTHTTVRRLAEHLVRTGELGRR